MGKIGFAGGKPAMEAPFTGILASELAVGSTVKLLENGVATEYLVVNQGIPSGSSLYDASCDGIWVLRKDIVAKQTWSPSGENEDYNASDMQDYLSGAFIARFDSVTKDVVKTVKIPFTTYDNKANNVHSGANGLETKAFLLSQHEVDGGQSASPVDGACLGYFNGISYEKKCANFEGAALEWWLRTPGTSNATMAYYVNRYGSSNAGKVQALYKYADCGARPAFVLPYNAVFDKSTLVLKGVA